MRRRDFIGGIFTVGAGLAVQSFIGNKVKASPLITLDGAPADNIQSLAKYIHDNSKEDYFVSIGSYQQHYRDASVRGTRIKLQVDSGEDAHNIKFFSIINRRESEYCFFDIGMDGHVDLILQNDSVLYDGDDVDALGYVLTLKSGLIAQPNKNFHMFKPDGSPDQLYHAELLKVMKKIKEG